MPRLQDLSRTAAPHRQRGLTLIEFMVSIVLGMIIVAALATLVADQSMNRSEVDRQGRLIENGRYAVRTLAEDLQLAGYWGEKFTDFTAPTAWADPCGADPAAPTQAEIEAGLGFNVTGFEVPGSTARPGYNDTTPLPVALGCLDHLRPGTDVVVIRRADPDSTPYETGGVPDTGKLNSGANQTTLFLQTGLDASSLFASRIATGANFASFDLKNKDGTMATVRKVVMRIYYVADCSVCSGGSADTLPTLKMRELGAGFDWSDPVTISEGIENLQVEWGLDSGTQDGAPDGADVAAAGVGLGNWQSAVTAKLYVLARSSETSPQYDDCADPAGATCKKYPLGLAGILVPTGTERNYKRHVFVQSVRLVNPSARRAL